MIAEPFLTVYLIHRQQKPCKRFHFFIDVRNHRAEATNEIAPLDDGVASLNF